MKRFGLVMAGVAILAASACPIGCPRPQPRRIMFGPTETVPTHQVAPCVWALDEPRSERYPSSEQGFYGVRLNGFANPLDYFSVNQDAGTITVKEPHCSDGVRSLG